MNIFAKSIFVVFLAILLSDIVKRAFDKILKKRLGENKRADTLLILFGKLISYIIYFLAGIELLDILFNIQPTAVLAGASVIGVSLGLGAQSIIKDIVAGVFIILENQYAVTEKITIGEFTGNVLEIGIRSTKIESDTGDILIIPNGMIEKVINHSRSNQGIYIYVTISHCDDIEKVTEIFKNISEIAEKTIFGILKKPRLLGISRLGAFGTKFDYFAKCRASTENQNRRELLKIIKEEFDNNNIKIIAE
jgi:small conductance mechanosensitive channel